MNKNQKCLITILQEHGDRLSTPEIIEFAGQYPDLCSGCSSGTHVISAGMVLVEKSLVKREIAKGGFVWSLVKKEKPLK